MSPIFGFFNRAPEELYVPDNTPNDIANNRLDTIRRNANHDHNDEMVEELERSHEYTKKMQGVATLIAADRLALHRTFAFIESRWKEGRSVEETFAEAENVRKKEFDEIVANKELVQKIKGGIKSGSTSISETREVLVNGLPIRRRAKISPSHRSPARPK